MDIENFTKQLEAELEDIAPGTLKPETSYKDLKNWNSMFALIIIAFVDMNFDVTLNGQDLKGANTVKELYDLVMTRTKNG